MDRDELEGVLRRTGVYDARAFSCIDLFDKPPWRYPKSRLLFELGWFGTSGYAFYEGPVHIGLAVHRGYVRSASVNGTSLEPSDLETTLNELKLREP